MIRVFDQDNDIESYLPKNIHNIYRNCLPAERLDRLVAGIGQAAAFIRMRQQIQQFVRQLICISGLENKAVFPVLYVIGHSSCVGDNKTGFSAIASRPVSPKASSRLGIT